MHSSYTFFWIFGFHVSQQLWNITSREPGSTLMGIIGREGIRQIWRHTQVSHRVRRCRCRKESGCYLWDNGKLRQGSGQGVTSVLMDVFTDHYGWSCRLPLYQCSRKGTAKDLQNCKQEMRMTLRKTVCDVALKVHWQGFACELHVKHENREK